VKNIFISIKTECTGSEQNLWPYEESRVNMDCEAEKDFDEIYFEPDYQQLMLPM